MAVAPVRVEGAAELRTGLRNISRGLATEFRKAEVEAAGVIAKAAAARAPRGHRPLPQNRRLRLHEAVRPLTAGARVYVGATKTQAPEANVVHWGGTIAPKGKPIRFPPRPFIVEAFEEKRPEYVAALAVALESLIRR